MEPGGSTLDSQGPSNNPYPEPNQLNSSHLRLGLPKRLFPAGAPDKILKALLSSTILATWPAHLSLLDLINLAHCKKTPSILSIQLC